MSTVPSLDKPRQQEPARAARPKYNHDYLMERGWTPLGNPADPTTQWIDPTRDPVEDKTEKVQKQMEPPGWIERTNKAAEKIGAPKVAPHFVEQVRITPRAEPMPFNDAIRIQYTRDMDEQRKVMEKQRKAEAPKATA